MTGEPAIVATACHSPSPTTGETTTVAKSTGGSVGGGAESAGDVGVLAIVETATGGDASTGCVGAVTSVDAGARSTGRAARTVDDVAATIATVVIGIVGVDPR